MSCCWPRKNRPSPAKEMPSYKLTYFNVRGRGEISRLIFAQAGVQYEDIRIPFGSPDWPKMKTDRAKYPLASMPTLEVDGKLIFQSMAIARYLGREFGMMGSNNMETTMVDIILDTCVDLDRAVIDIVFASEDKKDANTKVFKEEKGPLFLSALATILEKNGGKGYFVGNKMTVADIAVLHIADSAQRKVPDVVDKYPLITAFLERMKKEPKLAAWIAKRPAGDRDL